LKILKRISVLALGAAFTVSGLSALAGTASAQTTTLPAGSSVSAGPYQTTPQYNSAGQYEGDAAVVTISLGANTILTHNSGFRVEECNTGATAQTNCDGSTTQANNAVSGSPDHAGATGTTGTFTVLLWILPTGNAAYAPDVNDPANNNPSGFDPNSTVLCYSGQVCSLWIGSSETNWATGYLIDNLQPLPNQSALTPPTTTTAASTTTTAASTTTTAASTTTTAAPTTTTTAATTSTLPTTTTTVPTQGQVPESPYVPLLPIGAAGIAGAGFLFFRFRRRHAHSA
jgi:hypothetical protein